MESMVTTDVDGDFATFDVVAEGFHGETPEITVFQGDEILPWRSLESEDRGKILGLLARRYDFCSTKLEEFDASERFATVNELNAQNGCRR